MPTADLHVLMTTDAVGGVWQYSIDLARELTASGHTVTLAVLGPASDAAQMRTAEAIDGLQLVHTGQPIDWLCDNAAEVEKAALAVAALARSCRADLVHCNMPTLAGAARFPVPVLAVTHGCVATWWQAARDEPLDPGYRWHRDLMRRGLAAADVVAAPSASYAATIRDTYRLPRMPLVVHNGRHLSRRAATGERLDAALTVGRMWDSVKNAALLDQVAAAIDIPFYAAGALRGPHGEEAALTQLRPLGHLPDEVLNAWLAQQPVFVSAASFEPFGLAVLEAAAAGCALVLSDIGTFRELWDGAALFARPDDARGFAEAIERLRSDAALRDRMGQAAQQRARRYTPARMAGSVAAIYRQMLAGEEAAA